MNGNVHISQRLTNLAHTALLLAGMAVLMSALALLIAGPDALIWVVVIGGTVLILSPRLPPEAVMRFYRARPLRPVEAPGLYRMARELSGRAGLPTGPTLYVLPAPMMNAFTLGGRDRFAIALTDRVFQNLTDREMAAVLAHEIGHITNGDIGVMTLAGMVARITSTLSFIGQLLLFINLPLILMGAYSLPWGPILLLIAAPGLSGLMQMALSRTREFEADREAARLTGDPAGLAMALVKMEREQRSLWGMFFPRRPRPSPSSSPFRTHPDTKRRVERLMEMAGTRPGNIFVPPIRPGRRAYKAPGRRNGLGGPAFRAF